MRERSEVRLKVDGLNCVIPLRPLTIQTVIQKIVTVRVQLLLLPCDLLQAGLCLVQSGSELVLLRQQSVPVQRGQRIWEKEASRVLALCLQPVPAEMYAYLIAL